VFERFVEIVLLYLSLFSGVSGIALVVGNQSLASDEVVGLFLIGLTLLVTFGTSAYLFSQLWTRRLREF
jgi:hypothetical protein